MEELKITDVLADKACEVLMPHSSFTISISGCSNICTAAESKEVGIHGTAKPMVTEVECSQCRSCVDTCLDRIITLEDDGPVINEDYCKICGDCIRVCPTGTLAASEKGCRIMVARFDPVAVRLISEFIDFSTHIDENKLHFLT